MSSSKYINEKDIHDMLKPYAYKIIKDLSYQSHKAIDDFYSDKVFDGGTSCIPAIYKRTYGMKNLFRPSMKRTENGYVVEFTYSVDFLTTEHRSNDAVFDGSFINGFHGGLYAWGHKKPFVPQTTPSPWESISLYVKTYKI